MRAFEFGNFRRTSGKIGIIITPCSSIAFSTIFGSVLFSFSFFLFLSFFLTKPWNLAVKSPPSLLFSSAGNSNERRRALRVEKSRTRESFYLSISFSVLRSPLHSFPLSRFILSSISLLPDARTNYKIAYHRTRIILGILEILFFPISMTRRLIRELSTRI